MAETLTKLSVSTVLGKNALKKAVASGEITEPTPVMRVVGIAHRMLHGEGDNGPWTAFKGQFECTDLITGRVCNGGKLFLPACASDLIEGVLGNDDVENASFGFDIVCVPDEDSIIGYTYSAVSLLPPGENDPLTQLKNQIAGHLPAPDEAEPEKKAAPKKRASRAK